MVGFYLASPANRMQLTAFEGESRANEAERQPAEILWLVLYRRKDGLMASGLAWTKPQLTCVPFLPLSQASGKSCHLRSCKMGITPPCLARGGCVRIKSTAACEAVGCYRDDKGNISFVGYYGPFLHCNNNSNCTAELHTSRDRPSPAAFPRVSYPDWDCHRRAWCLPRSLYLYYSGS